ncbi:PP0621 family protein [Variovorax dokdonensis]|uniref:PP0621 family protein n=1 Tax=Variovorax dokdonensis TaxID=344883 RepID=A0ABT7NBG8_9BURK|nr:PP0621 family protein [Variovorax dokdonensis]MDM0045289.1 PP0621 family protein [Variovorax dokdonensis]
MKYLLVIAVVWIAFMIWRANRRDEIARKQPPAGLPRNRTPGEPQSMLRCAHCGLHLPAADALPGPDGKVYCSPAHRSAGPA